MIRIKCLAASSLLLLVGLFGCGFVSKSGDGGTAGKGGASGGTTGTGGAGGNGGHEGTCSASGASCDSQACCSG